MTAITTTSSLSTITQVQPKSKTSVARNTVSSTTKYSTTEEDLPPLPLVFVVILCSGFLLMFGIRDYMMTGRNIFGAMDEAFLIFTKSTDWFDDSNGWKSTQGGFSAIASSSTDHNNMGGFFIRKLAGAAVVGVQLQKLIPFIFHPAGAQFRFGHFRPLLIGGAVVNLASVAFWMAWWEDLNTAQATTLPCWWIIALTTEAAVFLYYVLDSTSNSHRGPAVAMKEGKTPSAVVSRIVSRTIMSVTSVQALLAARDLFFPGAVIDFVPRDDIFLEWTNAFLHSPPEGSPEDADHGWQALLFVGDKIISQNAALHILFLCFFKILSAVGMRYGVDGRGPIQTKMIWSAQCISNGMILFLLRLFANAAETASWDVRWHLMAMAYETFILGLYGFF